MQRGFMTIKWQLMIIKKTQDEKTVIYHKLDSDGNALTMMCGRN
jgi:hypothetical protein